MTPYEFLDDLERHSDQPWTEEETLWLWKLIGYRIPPGPIRTAYTQQAWRRREYIQEAREKLIAQIIKRLDE